MGKIKEKLSNILRFVALPFLVFGIALFLLIFGDPIDDDLGDDC